MYNQAVLLMSGQQLTTMCIFVTTWQIVHGQFGLYNLVPQYFNVMYGPSSAQNQPLRDYHYETREHIRKSYPRNSYRIMDLETALARGLLQHQQQGRKKHGGGKKRRGGGDGDGSDDVTNGGQAGGGGDPGLNDENFPPNPTEKEHADRKKRGFSVPDAGHFDATSVAAVAVQAVPKTSGEQSVQHVNSLDTILKEHDVVGVQNLFETLVYTTMKFDRSVTDADKRKLIATTVNATMLFIANILGQYKLEGT